MSITVIKRKDRKPVRPPSLRPNVLNVFMQGCSFQRRYINRTDEDMLGYVFAPYIPVFVTPQISDDGKSKTQATPNA